MILLIVLKHKGKQKLSIDLYEKKKKDNYRVALLRLISPLLGFCQISVNI